MNFLVIPSDLKQLVASFLCASDAIQLSSTCKAIRAEVSLSAVRSPVKFWDERNWSGEYRHGDTPRPHCSIPLVPKCHSVALTCRWRDQGWGNRKGQVYIVEEDQKQGAASSASRHYGSLEARRQDPFQGALVVYGSHIAEHHATDLKITFMPKPGKSYYFWVKPGGGGGHSLHVSNLRLHMLVFDDSEKNLSRNLKSLYEGGAIKFAEGNQEVDGNVEPFFPRMLLTVSESLRSQLAERMPVDPFLSQFLEARGVSVNEASLLALEKILQNHQPIHILDTPPENNTAGGRGAAGDARMMMLHMAHAFPWDDTDDDDNFLEDMGVDEFPLDLTRRV